MISRASGIFNVAQDPLLSVGLRHENEAIRACSRRTADLRDSLGTYHPEYATGLNQLSLLLIMQGEAEAAEPFLREALEVRRIALGESHPDYATNLSSLGGILWARGELQEAEPILRKVYEIRAKTLGAEHPKTVTSRNSFEQVSQARKQWEADCLSQMRRSRLGSANETASLPVAVRPEPQSPPALSGPFAVSSNVPTSLVAVSPVLAGPKIPNHAVTLAAPVTAPMPAKASSEPVPIPRNVPAASVTKLPTTVSIPIPLSDSIDSIIANHLDLSIRGISVLDSPSRPASAPTPSENSANDFAKSRLSPTLRKEIPTRSGPAPNPIEQVPAHDHSSLLASVDAAFKDLSKQLTQSARDLLSEGICPSEDLEESCREVRKRFLALVETVEADAKRVDPTAPPPPCKDLAALRRFSESFTAKSAERHRQRQREGLALQVLFEMDRLTCPSTPHFEPLEQCRAEAESLVRAIQTGQDLGPERARIIDSLMNGTHPFHAVLKLTREGSSLTDREWSTAYETIVTRFGNPLAIAVGRGRVVHNPS